MGFVVTKQASSILARQTLDTKYHIDFEYWDRADRDLNIYLRSHLCPEHQEVYADVEADTADVSGQCYLPGVLIKWKLAPHPRRAG